MLAAVYHGPRDIRVEEVDDPEPGPGEVLVEVCRNGICGSDLHTYVGGTKGAATMHAEGVVLGHEFAGTVREVGDGIDDLAVGTAVAIAPIEWCGNCYSCMHGWPQMCRRLGIYGGYGLPLHGGLAPLVSVSRRAAFAVPETVGLVEAALAEPMAVAVHAVRRAPNLLGANVMVLGAGPIGLGILQAATAAGARKTIVTEIATGRRAAAGQLGATAVVDPTLDDPREVVRDLARDGLDVVFETTGQSAALDQGIRSLRPRGKLVSVAGWSDFAQVDMGVSMAKEIELRFTMTYEPEIDFPMTLDMLANGAFDTDVLISDHISLERVVEDGLEELLHHADRHVKILVDPS